MKSFHPAADLNLQAASQAEHLHRYVCTACTSQSSSRQPPHIHHSLVSSVVKHALSNPLWQDNMEFIVRMINVCIIPTLTSLDDYSTAFLVASGSAVSGVCGVVWKQNEYAYKCRTCERDPTCVICDQCFRNGDHSGHDYAMVRTGGGCCDCGDPQAWHREGFCSRHRGPSSELEDPVAEMDPEFRNRLVAAVQAVAAHLVVLCVNLHHNTNTTDAVRNSNVARTVPLLHWLCSILVSDGICRAVGNILIETAPAWLYEHMVGNYVHNVLEVNADELRDQSWLSMMLRIDGTDRLPQDVQTSAQTLYFKLITDVIFKRSFFECFINNYERYVHAQLNRLYIQKRRGNLDSSRPNNSDIVHNFSVQLFTVPALVPVMIREGGLLDVMLRVMLNLFEISSFPVHCYIGNVPYEESSFAAKYESLTEARSASGSTMANSSTGGLHGRRTEASASDQESSGPRTSRDAGLEAVMALLATIDRSVDNSLGQTEATGANTGGNAPMEDTVRPAGNTEGAADADNVDSIIAEVDDSVSFDDAVVNEARVAAGHDNEIDEAVMDNIEGALLPRGEDIDEEGDPDVVMNEDDNAVIIINDGMMVAAEGLEGTPENGLFQEGLFPAVNVFLQLANIPNTDETEDHVAENGMEIHAANFNMFRGSENNPRMETLAIHSQIKAFEDGLQFKPTSYTRILSEPTPSNRLSSAIARAREMTPAALNGSGVLAHPLRVDWSTEDRIDVDPLIWRVMSDLSYILSHESAAFNFLHQRPCSFRMLLRILSMVQGMFPYARRFGDHAPASTDDWSRGFTLESEFYRIFDLVASAFCARDANKYAEALGPSVSDVDLPASRRRLIGMVRLCLDQWLFREQSIEALSTYAGEEFTVAHSQSVYLPLHRLLSLFAHHVIRVDNVDVATALSLGCKHIQKEDAKRLLTHPLRLQSFFSQVRAGMWRRNGQPVIGQAFMYSKLVYSEWFVELDLFLKQCCAVILGPEDFIAEAKRAFRIDDLDAVVQLVKSELDEDSKAASSSSNRWGSVRGRAGRASGGRHSNQDCSTIENQASNDGDGKNQFGLLPLAPLILEKRGLINAKDVVPHMGNSKPELAKFMQTVIEEFLIVLVRVASERSRCGQSSMEWLRSRIVHELAPEDKSYTSLKKSCSMITLSGDAKIITNDEDNESRISESLIENVLYSVAQYIPPKGMKQGTYRLKNSAWKEFDPFCPYLSRRERCSAEVRYNVACKENNILPQAIPTAKVSNRPIYKQFMDLELIPFTACGSSPDAVANIVLRKSVPKEGGGYWVGVLAASFHLICMCVEIGDSPHRDAALTWLNQISDVETFSNSSIEAVCKISASMQSKHPALYSEFKPVLERIIRQAYVLADLPLRRILIKTFPQALPKDVIGFSNGSSADELSPEEKRRQFLQKKKQEQQAAAMKQMLQAQKTFAQLIDSEVKTQSSSGELDLSTNVVKRVDDSEKSSAEGKKRAFNSSETLAGTRKNQEEQCVLCHGVGHEEGKGGLIGKIGFHQDTRIPLFAQHICNSRPRNREVVNERNERRMSKSLESSDDEVMGLPGDGLTESLRSSPSEFPLGEVGLLSSMDEQVIRHGIEEGQTVHVSLCGHAVHIECFEGFFNSLLRSKDNQMVFAGSEVVDLNKREFFCPGCRRLSNLILPTVDHVRFNLETSDSDQRDEVNVGNLPFEEWLQRRGDEIKQECDLEGVLGRSSGGDVGKEISGKRSDLAGKTVFSMRVIELMKAFRFIGTDGWESDSELEVPMYDVLAWFADCLLTTAACAEIGARMVDWSDALLQQSRRSLGSLMHLVRDQIAVERGVRVRALRILWKFVTDTSSTRKKDAYVCTFLLMILWSKRLSWGDVKMIVRLGFNILLREHGDVKKKTIEFIMKALLYCRRAVVMSAIGEVSQAELHLQHYGKVPNLSNGRLELLDLMSIFDVGQGEVRQTIDAFDVNVAVDWFKVQVGFFPIRVGLLPLPKEFGMILEQRGKAKCVMCESELKMRVVCLICGMVMCNSKKCGNNGGGSAAHAMVCGGGVGIFLSLNWTTVEIRRWKRRTEWGSIYLDIHGEGDEHLQRGKALYLCEPRYRTLEKLWILHGFDQDSYILSRGPRRGLGVF